LLSLNWLLQYLLKKILQNKGYEADGNRSTTEHQTNVTVAIDLDCYSAEQKKKALLDQHRPHWHKDELPSAAKKHYKFISSLNYTIQIQTPIQNAMLKIATGIKPPHSFVI
jgi:hypothetical protein